MPARHLAERKFQIVSAALIVALVIFGIWYAWFRSQTEVTPHVERSPEELEQALTAPPGSMDAVSPAFIKEVIKQTTASPAK